jgi:hypothetical protein
MVSYSVIVFYGNYQVPLSVRLLSILLVTTDCTYESRVMPEVKNDSYKIK